MKKLTLILSLLVSVAGKGQDATQRVLFGDTTLHMARWDMSCTYGYGKDTIVQYGDEEPQIRPYGLPRIDFCHGAPREGYTQDSPRVTIKGDTIEAIRNLYRALRRQEAKYDKDYWGLVDEYNTLLSQFKSYIAAVTGAKNQLFKDYSNLSKGYKSLESDHKASQEPRMTGGIISKDALHKAKKWNGSNYKMR